LARLALIIAMARSTEARTEERVTGEDMRSALQLIEYFKAATRKVHGQLFEANPDDLLAENLMAVLTDSEYVFSGTMSELMELLDSTVRPDSPEALGRAIRRIAERSPSLTVESKRKGTGRLTVITLKKPSQPSQPSPEDLEQDGEPEPHAEHHNAGDNKCIHGYPGGRGCYLHDPEHPMKNGGKA
jgi:hypothetical protein